MALPAAMNHKKIQRIMRKYALITRGTGFEVDTRKMRNYRRQPEREELVEEKVAKERILEVRGAESTSARIPPVP